MKQYASSALRLRDLFVCIVVLLAGSLLAAAQHESVLHSFGVQPGDGINPLGGLIADASGNLYGTTFVGGANNLGTVYQLSPPVGSGPWTETVLYSFTGEEDGANPWGNLVFDDTGNLYGVAGSGGNAVCILGGCGTIFELSPPSVPGGNWTETPLYAFAGGTDGIYPNSGIVFDAAGNLYGSTFYGGNDSACKGPPVPGCGTVFEVSPPSTLGGPWTETVLYRFGGGLDGEFPEAPVTLDQAGNLYGTTITGGRVECEFAPCGTVFKLTPSQGGTWTKTVIHNFGSLGFDGFSPTYAALLVTDTGAIVGTTPEGGANGGGTVFGMLPPSRPDGHWSYAVLYSFDPGDTGLDGLVPKAAVIHVNDALYGTTNSGGAEANGTVFQLSPTNQIGVWQETGLYSFQMPPSDGASPATPLLLHENALFGTTEQGGDANFGTVFAVRH